MTVTELTPRELIEQEIKKLDDLEQVLVEKGAAKTDEDIKAADTQAAAVLMGGYVMFGVAVIAAMLLRKISKYSNLTRLKIGPDGVEIDTEAKNDNQEV